MGVYKCTECRRFLNGEPYSHDRFGQAYVDFCSRTCERSFWDHCDYLDSLAVEDTKVEAVIDKALEEEGNGSGSND